MSTPIRLLKPSHIYEAITARVCRLWTNNDFKTNKLISLDCLLVDEEHEAIQGSIQAHNVDIVSNKIQLGTIYEIKNFLVNPSKARYKVVPHTAQLQFTRVTTFTPITEEIPLIPHHKFNFIEYDQLSARVDIHDILSDVIGVLVTFHGIEQTNIDGKITSRRTLIIENIRSETLPVTLWGTIAEKFDDTILKSVNDSTVIIFAAMSVKQFRGSINVASTSATLYYINLEIPETKTLKKRFSQRTQQIEFIPAAVKSIEPVEEQKSKNRIKIIMLKELDPFTNQDINFTVRATITRFDTSQSWYYNSCPHCAKPIKEQVAGSWCEDHGHLKTTPRPWYKLNTYIEDETGEIKIIIFEQPAQKLIKKSSVVLTINEGYADPLIIPPIIEQLRGQTKIFQVYYRIRKKDFNPQETLIHPIVLKIFDDDQPSTPLLSAPTTIPLDPKTPDPKKLAPSAEKEMTTTSTKRKLISQEDQQQKKKEKL